jgi:AraC-like DNA-binding protein
MVARWLPSFDFSRSFDCHRSAEPGRFAIWPSRQGERTGCTSLNLAWGRGGLKLPNMIKPPSRGAPRIMLICGFFRASYGQTIELFGTLRSPIAEQFDASHQLDTKLKAAIAELVAQEVGSKAMSSALLKQIIVALLRRSLTSLDHWAERFAILRDPKIARAFAEMAAYPGAPHTVKSLAARACLSRSAFMGRFVALVGSTPMAVLRELRMRQAARQLRLNQSTVEQVGQAAGYRSRIAFSRAFRKAFGCDPSDYRDREATGSTNSVTRSLESSALG